MKTGRKTLISLSIAAAMASSALAAPGGKGGGKPDKPEEPSGPFVPAFVYTESGKNSTVSLANRELTSHRTIGRTSDGRTDGLVVDPRGGRIVANEFRDLYEYRYDINASGEVNLTQREYWEGGIACLAIAHDGLAIRSSTVQHGYHIRYLDGSESALVPTERMDGCDFYDGTHDFVTFVSPDNGTQRLERHGLDGSVELLYDPGATNWSFRGVDVAPDGQTYVISWWDRRNGQSLWKVSIWQPGQDLTAITPVVVGATNGSWACDWNADGSPDGVIYREFGTSRARWILDNGSIRDITPSRKDTYAMKATC